MKEIATRPPDTQALAILSRSEIEAQVISAEARPRDLEVFQHKVGALVTMSQATAEECFYELPARREGGEPIEGPSIRLAEILVSQYCNCRVQARVIEQAAEYIVAQGIFLDLETNVATTAEVRRRIVDKKGRTYSHDMINQTANAACSIAKRNAILAGIPKPLWHPYYERARTMAAGDDSTIEERRNIALGAFARLGIDEARVLAMLKLKTREEIDGPAIVKLRGTYTAIRDGELSISEAFPADQPKAARAAEPATLEEFAEMGKKRTYSTPPPEGEPSSAAEAYAMGQEARRRNAGRTQWPARWKDQPNIEAWIAGWDSENAEIGKERN